MEVLREEAGALTSTGSIASFKGLLFGVGLGLALWGVIGLIWWMV